MDLNSVVGNELIVGPGSVGVDVSFLNFENVYGIPEHADAFSLRPTQ